MMGLPTDVVLTSIVAVLCIIGVIVGDYGIAAQVKPVPANHNVPGGNTTKWVYKDVDISSLSGYTAEKSTTEVKAGNSPPNTTHIKAVLTWTDDYGSNDVFKIEIKLDGKSLGTQQGSSGSLTVDSNATEGQNLTGNITALVTCVSSPGLIGPNPLHIIDKGNNWNLKVGATFREKE